jgi:hypothetical protein
MNTVKRNFMYVYNVCMYVYMYVWEVPSPNVSQDTDDPDMFLMVFLSPFKQILG